MANNVKQNESQKDRINHHNDLRALLNYDEDEQLSIQGRVDLVHMSHRFAKTFYPEQEGDYLDDIEFVSYTQAERLRLLGTSLVDL